MPSGGFWQWLALIATTGCWGLFVLVWLVGAVYNVREAPRVEHRSAFPVAWLIGIIAFVIVYRLVPARLWRPITVDIHWLIVVGVVVLAAATAFTIWARIALGTMWTSTPVIKNDHLLRTEGPYALTRHPIYSGLLGMLAGTACIFGLGRWLAIFAVGVVLVDVKLRAEERLLERAFPGDYQRYRQQVPRLIPRLRRAR